MSSLTAPARRCIICTQLIASARIENPGQMSSAEPAKSSPSSAMRAWMSFARELLGAISIDLRNEAGTPPTREIT